MTRWSQMFDGNPQAVGEARRFARTVTIGHHLIDEAELVVSELATNAVEHTDSGKPGGSFVVEVEVFPTHVRVAVVDMGAASTPASTPACSPGDPASETAVSGRGLFLVAALAAKWGTEPVRVGCRVWAEVYGEVS